MKVVDEKGKIFGKLNIIDLIALLIIIAAIIFGVYKLAGSRSSSGATPSAGPTRLVYTVQVPNVNADIYQEVLRQMELAGGRDQLMASGELLNAYVTGVEAVPHISYTTDAQGNLHVVEDTGDDARLDLTFTVEATVADPITNQVGTQEVRVAKSHILKTVHFEFSYSTVITCDWG